MKITTKKLIFSPLKIIVLLVLCSLPFLFIYCEFEQSQASFISSFQQNQKSINPLGSRRLLQPAYSKSKTSNSTGWYIRQNHILYGKNIHIFISPDGFKWNSKDSDITIAMKAPKWEVASYSTATQKMYLCSPEDFQSPATKMDVIFGGVNWSALIMKRIKRATKNGVTIDYYRMEKSLNQHVNKTDYWVCPDIHIPGPVQKVITKLYNAPNLKGFPTKQMYQRKKGGVTKVGFYTYSINQKQIPRSRFNIPKNYKRVKSLNNLYRNETHEQGLDLLLRK